MLPGMSGTKKESRNNERGKIMTTEYRVPDSEDLKKWKEALEHHMVWPDGYYGNFTCVTSWERPLKEDKPEHRLLSMGAYGVLLVTEWCLLGKQWFELKRNGAIPSRLAYRIVNAWDVCSTVTAYARTKNPMSRETYFAWFICPHCPIQTCPFKPQQK